MNILPKKSWHVRNKDNIAKVRRDEAQAAAEEEARLSKIALAEQEARTSLLRSRVVKQTRDNDEVFEEVKQLVPRKKASEQSGHINLFTDFEEGKRKNEGVNPEHEEEKKQEKEAFEKQIGLLTYLGQSAIDAQKSTPWYARVPDRKTDDDKTEKDKEKDKRSKSYNDPIHDMLAQIRVVRKREGRDGEGSSSKKHKRDKDIKAIIASSSVKKPAKTIEQLRAERIKREREERAKVLQLMSKEKGEKEQKPEENPDDRSRKYHSQFNPQFARR